MGRQFQTWVYVTDNGALYSRKVALDIAAQETPGNDPLIGSGVAVAVHPPLPKSFKPRVALAQDQNFRRYRIVAMSADAPILEYGATIDLFDRDGGAAITVTVYGTEGERSRNKLLTTMP
jgi:hypothetical protein